MKNELDPIQGTIVSYDNHYRNYSEETKSVDTYPGLRDRLNLFINLLHGERVLDVGFGSGRDTLYFQEHDLTTVSIDLSVNFIHSLKEIVDSSILFMDMQALAFRNQYFDGVWTCASLLHLPKKSAHFALSEFNRVLVYGGLLYISVKEGDGEQWIQDGSIESPRYFTHYSLDEICALVSSAGFHIHSVLKQPLADSGKNWLNLFARKFGMAV